jgi:hypothetical protein
MAASSRDDDGYWWLGDAGFFAPDTAEAGRRWLDLLAERRWPSMHIDLLPIAVDGSGNRYCFVRSEQPGMPREAVVCWMYETYRAVPIATTFDGFVDWLVLGAVAAARRGDDPLLDRTHLETRILPAAERLGRPGDLVDAITTAMPGPLTVSEAMLARHPDAPGPSVMVAARRLEEGEFELAASNARTAGRAFPEFAAAWTLAAAGDPQASHARFRALWTALHQPLLYCGDPWMPNLDRIPEVKPDRLAESLATHPWAHEISAWDPVWDLVLAEDPLAATAWLGVGVALANENELQYATLATANALWLGDDPEERGAAVELLGEIYGALGWSWHASMCALDRTLCERALRRRED